MPSPEFIIELEESMPESNAPPNEGLQAIAAPPFEVDYEEIGAVGQLQLSLELPGSADFPDFPYFEPSPRSFYIDTELLEWDGQQWPGVEPDLTLEELLVLDSGRTDLENVDCVRLNLMTSMMSLSNLSSYVPRLAFLDLSGSMLYSLHDLGTNLLHLTHLNVTNCGLNSLDGTHGFLGLQVLIADENMVELVNPLADLVLLNRLSMRNNRISDMATLTFLGLCPNLVQLELQGNPVTYSLLYRSTLQRTISSLELLDGEFLWLAELEDDGIGEDEADDEDEEDDENSNDSSASSLSSYESFSASSGSLHSADSHFELLLCLDDAVDRPASPFDIEIDEHEPPNPPQQKRAADSALPSATATKRRMLSPSLSEGSSSDNASNNCSPSKPE